MSAVPTTAVRPRVRVSLAALARRLSLPALFAASCVFQFAQSRAHVAPTVFDDELLYAKLSQGFAAGHWLAIRGEHYSFPSPVAPLLQAPAWLLGSMTDGYAAAKLLNAVVMSAAVFPAYWLARLVAGRTHALVVAAATVAAPAMVYHAFLMSEAAAYPVFVLTIAVLVRAAATPTRKLGLGVPAVCVLAVATRVQFIVLPLAYLAAAAVCGRGRRRAYVLPIAGLTLLGVALAAMPRALGSYSDAGRFHYAIGGIAHWALTNASLLPFSLGFAVVPGALLGLAYALARPRTSHERAFAVVAVATLVLFVGQAAAISAGEAHRPLERYLFYLTPLAFTAFFAYVERGAPRRAVHLCVAGALALGLAQVSLPGLTGTAAFFFDSVTESAYANAAAHWGLANASLAFSLGVVVLAGFAVVAPLRRTAAAVAVAATAIGVQLWLGNAVAATDHLATAWSLRTFSATPANWLDEAHLGAARYVVLPDAESFTGATLESFNRSVRAEIVLQAPPPDPFPVAVGRVARDGTLLVDERPTHGELLVLNTTGSQIGIDGRVVARPRDGLVAERIPAGAKVHWLADGLGPDRWTGRHLTYRAWPERPGRYHLVLSANARTGTRIVELGSRRIAVRPGHPTHLTARANGPLRLHVEIPPGPVATRVFGVRVDRLRFVPAS